MYTYQMRLDLRRLTYFKAIADAGSLSEAARFGFYSTESNGHLPEYLPW